MAEDAGLGGWPWIGLRDGRAGVGVAADEGWEVAGEELTWRGEDLSGRKVGKYEWAGGRRRGRERGRGRED